MTLIKLQVEQQVLNRGLGHGIFLIELETNPVLGNPDDRGIDRAAQTFPSGPDLEVEDDPGFIRRC